MARPRKYSDELRERAVRLVFESERPIAHVARDLGIHKEALRQWVRQAEADTGRRPSCCGRFSRRRRRSTQRPIPTGEWSSPVAPKSAASPRFASSKAFSLWCSFRAYCLRLSDVRETACPFGLPGLVRSVEPPAPP